MVTPFCDRAQPLQRQPTAQSMRTMSQIADLGVTEIVTIGQALAHRESLAAIPPCSNFGNIP
jgi:hypothetical protein